MTPGLIAVRQQTGQVAGEWGRDEGVDTVITKITGGEKHGTTIYLSLGPEKQREQRRD